MILGRDGKKAPVIEKLIINDVEVNGDKSVAIALNQYFSNIGKMLNENFINIDLDFRRYMKKKKSVFKFVPIDPTEIISIVSKLNLTSAGSDELPMFVFKENIVSLSEIIAHICNKSIIKGQYPKILSIAKVLCLFKSGDPSSISNYRPISILPCFSKILEKVFEAQLRDYLELNGIFCKNQFGFRRGRSTETAVHSLVKFFHDSFNEGKYGMAIFFDLKKAFDSLDRSILLEKIKYYGILGNEWKWLASYLSDRCQYTVINGVS